MCIGWVLTSIRHALWAMREERRTGSRMMEQFGVGDCLRRWGMDVRVAAESIVPVGMR